MNKTIDRNSINYRAGRIKLYACGFGTDKEQRKIINGGDIEALEKALEFIINDTSLWNWDNKQYGKRRIENRIKYLKSLTPKN